jgi:hypothetical protein
LSVIAAKLPEIGAGNIGMAFGLAFWWSAWPSSSA